LIENRDVFINCPFSNDYVTFFRAIIFTVASAGFTARCALEADDSSENRFDKICKIIAASRLAVHDISKTELDQKSKLPRFNMPLELGLFLAAKKFGNADQKKKRCIIFDRAPYRYQKFMSDISGQDIHSHGGKTSKLIEEISSWLRYEVLDPKVPGGAAIAKEFKLFSRNLPRICQLNLLKPQELTFQDYRKIVGSWIVERTQSENPP
jgi:hypothetical protein